MKYYPGDVLDIYPDGKKSNAKRIMVVEACPQDQIYRCIIVREDVFTHAWSLFSHDYDRQTVEDKDPEFVGVMDISVLIGKERFRKVIEDRLKQNSKRIMDEMTRNEMYFDIFRELPEEDEDGEGRADEKGESE